MSYSNDGDIRMAEASRKSSIDSLYRVDRPEPLIKSAAQPVVEKPDEEMGDDTLIKPDPDQPRETTETAEPHSEIAAGGDNNDDDDDDGNQANNLEVKYENRGQLVDMLGRMQENNRNFKARNEQTKAFLAREDAVALVMNEEMERANTIADDFIALVVDMGKREAREAEERAAKAVTEEARRLEGEAKAEAAMQQEEVLREAALLNPSEERTMGTRVAPDVAMNLLSDRASQMSIGGSGKKTPEMLVQEKHRLSEDSKFSKDHHNKKHQSEPLPKLTEENLPEYAGESDDEQRTAAKPKRKSAFDLFRGAGSRLGLNLFTKKSTADGLHAASNTEATGDDAATSFADSAPFGTDADGDRMESVIGAEEGGAHFSVGDTHEDEAIGGDDPPPEVLPDSIQDFRVWNESAFVPLDDFVTPDSQAYKDIKQVCDRCNLRVGGHLRNCQKDGDVAHDLPACQTCRQINLKASSCTNEDNLTKKTVCHVCSVQANHPCCRLIKEPGGGYFFGFLPVANDLRPGLSPDDEFYWKVKKEKKPPKPRSIKGKDTDKDTDKDGSKKEGTRRTIGRKAKDAEKKLMT